MRVAIIGAGCVGSWIGGHIAAAGTADVLFLTGERSGESLRTFGRTLHDFDRTIRVQPDAYTVAQDATELADVDGCIVCVKSVRTRPTEIRDLNERIVRMGRDLGIPTPANAAIVRLVREAEEQGIPGFTAEEMEQQVCG